MKLLTCLSLFGMLLLASCSKNSEEGQSNDDKAHSEEAMPDIDGVSELRTPSGDSPQRDEISKAELPEEVINLLDDDSLLSTLQLKKVYKVLEDGETFYDIAFETDEKETMMVLISADGEVLAN
ncbi:hypothetical protein Echvi_2184 [Echinicola vietnamensis DSM 17526]|uniref:Beta-lactamase-inhibitor-like PepSY-like domain-containing protein n=2 Tax=Echinicola TaxID=390846 RepID=L0G0Q1_ECHVK|nr:hypothetical protein Echvi_2184 [Echinicola vietnamensis DSM 17526]